MLILEQVKDNVAQHWTVEAIRLITARGAIIIYLPPYSPELNPIELGFGWLKFYIRRHADRLGGTNRAVREAITEGLEALPADTMAQYFRHSGYVVPVRLAPRTRDIVLTCVMAVAVLHDSEQ